MMNKKLAKINNAILTYNEKNDDKVLTEIKKDIEDLNKDILIGFYEKLCATENPFLKALKDPYYKIKKLSLKELDNETFEAKIADVIQIINLMDFEDWYLNEKNANVKDGTLRTLSANYQWRYRLEKVCQVFAIRIAKEFDQIIDKEKYRISTEGNLIQVPNETSNRQTEKLLQFIVDGIVFVPSDKDPKINKFKVTKKDILFIEHLMCKEGKKTGLCVPRQSRMLRLITKMLNRIVTNSLYEIE